MEFCPVCMLRKGLAGGVESAEASVSGDMVTLTACEQAPQRFEHYELLTGQNGKPVELGRGAMGVTYKAFETRKPQPEKLAPEKISVARLPVTGADVFGREDIAFLGVSTRNGNLSTLRSEIPW
jgi:hypothetical protein